MEYIKKGFTLNYDLQELGLIKPGGHGDYNGKPYKASLKIKTSNIIQQEHEEMGLVDKEELLEFIIRCETNLEASELGKMFRILKSNGVVVHFSGSLPKYSDKSEYLKVDVLSTPEQLMKKYNDLLKVNDKK
jgi:hypothetical protein